MKASAFKYTILTAMVSLIMVIVALLPFHAFLTVWLASSLGHYTALRLWKEVLLMVCLGGAFYLLLTDRKIRTHTLPRRLMQLTILFLLIQLLWGLVALRLHDLNRKALGYGLIIDCRFLLFFLITWTVALRTNRLHKHWQKLLIWPAIAVIAFGLLQVLVLPKDFLAHFGYGPQTILPYETINHNQQYVRIAATLRGANPLGAYLLIPLSALAVLLARGKWSWRKLVLLLAGVMVLFFSFSRGAWLGAVVSLAVITAVSVHAKKLQRLLIYGGVAAVLVLAGGALALRHNVGFENLVFHTQEHSAVKKTSDQGHASALKNGLSDIVRQPLGRGPGSAGPASVYNNHPARISENFFVQIGQETGWLGLFLFLLINGAVGYLLWLRRSDSLALSLLASLIGLSIVNLLSHAWADDTLAYVWWGLAGIAMARAVSIDQAKPEDHHAGQA